jgi:hypothetical protein
MLQIIVRMRTNLRSQFGLDELLPLDSGSTRVIGAWVVALIIGVGLIAYSLS